MKITFIAPRLQRDKFTGGIYCILRHANELCLRGHDVTVVASPRSEVPEWMDIRFKLILPALFTNQRLKSPIENIIAVATHAIGYVGKKYNGGQHAIASLEGIVKHYLPESDVTIATLWETARLVAKHGKGKRAYFCQHYEPLFFEDSIDQADVAATYRYGLNLIANSLWLKERFLEDARPAAADEIRVVNNAIDGDVFYPRKGEAAGLEDGIIRIISYGGRDAKWKGFHDMAKAVAIARKNMPHLEVFWSVYGEALLPPDNPIASYRALGFLHPESLAQEYSRNDILLSASWYESFPLFPIEAMACGLGVITTGYGVEDYAMHGRNCLIVQPGNPESIAAGIISLATNPGLLARLRANAPIDAGDFNWDRASAEMERALRFIVDKQ